MHEGGSSSGGRFHQSHHITPDHNPAFGGRRGGEFGRCYRELACFQVSLMRRVLSRSLSLIKSLDSLVVNLCSRGFSRAQKRVLMGPGQWMLPDLNDYPDIAAGRGETLGQSRELGSSVLDFPWSRISLQYTSFSTAHHVETTFYDFSW